MYKKIKFLIQSKASLLIIVKYIIFKKIIRIFIRSNQKKFRKKNKNFLKKKKITCDFFSYSAYIFYYFLKKKKKNSQYLEIGSYEGASALFVSRTFKKFKIYCVDPWDVSNNINSKKEFKNKFSTIEKNFNSNIKCEKLIKKIKKTSDSFFFKNKIKFDIIYIDGYHYARQVYKDCINSWKTLNNDGLIIIDDYFWKFYKKIEDNPCFAVNKFLKKIKGEFSIEMVTDKEIIIKKKCQNLLIA